VAKEAGLTKRERELGKLFKLIMDIQFIKHKLRVMTRAIKRMSLPYELKEYAVDRFNQAEKILIKVSDELLVLFEDEC